MPGEQTDAAEVTAMSAQEQVQVLFARINVLYEFSFVPI